MATALADEIYAQFSQRLLQLSLAPNTQLVAALGGGADSQSTLDLLDRFRQHHPEYRYLAIHLDHHFHPDSPQWAAQIKADAERREFPVIVEPLEVPLGKRQSKEAQGRQLRYQRLSELTDNNALILLGQHRNDQIETFLLQLNRGSGPKGLAAMGEVADFTGGRRLWRPLLQVSKADILSYAKQRQLFWIEDETNLDTRIERNFLRHDVIPTIEQRWPQFGHSVLRSAALCAEQQALLEELLSVELTQLTNSEGALAVDALKLHSEAFQRAVLRQWLQQQQVSMPSQAQLEQMRQQMLFTTNDAQPQVGWGPYVLSRTRSRHLVVTTRER
ncbi:MAG: tRNA lysidine(34) synthetase TilS [Idiomarina sp.]